MKQLNSVWDNEKGSVILIVIVVLMAISGLVLTALNFTAMEVNVAGSYKFDKEAFAMADSGINGTSPFVRSLLPEAAPIAAEDPARAGCVQFLNTTSTDPATEIRNRIYGFAGRDDTADYNTPDDEDNPLAADISMRGCAIPADINIIPLRAQYMTGGGAEFGMAGEGIGASGAAKYFRLVSNGNDAQNTTYTVRAIYRWVDIAGGQ